MSIVKKLNLKVKYSCCPYYGEIINNEKWKITKEWLSTSEIKYVDIRIYMRGDYNLVRNEYFETYKINVPRKIESTDFIDKNDMIEKLDKTVNNTNVSVTLVVRVNKMKRNVMLQIN